MSCGHYLTVFASVRDSISARYLRRTISETVAARGSVAALLDPPYDAFTGCRDGNIAPHPGTEPSTCAVPQHYPGLSSRIASKRSLRAWAISHR